MWLRGRKGESCDNKLFAVFSGLIQEDNKVEALNRFPNQTLWAAFRKYPAMNYSVNGILALI